MNIAVMPALLFLIACGGNTEREMDSARDELSKAEYEAEAGPKIVPAADLPADLQTAAASGGDLPCGLPRIPGELQSHKVDRYSHAFLSARPFGEVAGFYKLAADKAGHSATVAAMPGTIEVNVAIPDGATCSVQAQDGGVHRTPEGEDKPATGVIISQEHA